MSRFWKPGSEKPSSLLVDDEEGGVVFLPSSTSSASSSGFGYASLERQRQRLPVYKYRKAILYLVEHHPTTIVVGETGSGKSTQIPQYLKEAGWADGGRLIGCTQPRRLAVQTVASRVAEEMGVKLGEEVGYTIRFEDQTNPGDHMTFLNIYKGFHQSGKSSQWCYKNFLNYQALKKVIDIRGQLLKIVKGFGIPLKSCDRDMQAVRKAIIAGSFANACHLEEYNQNGMYTTVRTSQEVYIHPSSVLFRVNTKWVVYQSLVSTDNYYMRNVIAIEPSWLTEAAPHFYQFRTPNPALHWIYCSNCC